MRDYNKPKEELKKPEKKSLFTTPPSLGSAEREFEKLKKELIKGKKFIKGIWYCIGCKEPVAKDIFTVKAGARTQEMFICMNRDCEREGLISVLGHRGE